MSKIALITGATSGIGAATSHLLAANGFDLILTGRRNKRLVELERELSSRYKVKCLLLCFDVTKLQQVQTALDSLPGNWKAIDVLINNAGLAVGMDTVDNGEIDDWERMIDTNVKGLLYMTRTVVPWMKVRKSGHVINISSLAGKESYPMGGVYCGTKHAVQAITHAMRVELLPFGVKVGTIAPGMVNTEFSNVRFKGDDERAQNVYKGITPLYPADIAETILFMITRPAHVNIDDLLIMPTNQGSARDVFRNPESV
ncbi:MAG TPA: SDR family NAD(P)-dependent oxidoreductase [Prolixibacteraceae bacterium]|nr:SDR family NAD(P)-dependent oxidoreductase [Prolixibacteraceae bacterium]